MSMLEALHTLGKDDIAFRPLLNAEVRSLEEQYQEHLAAKKIKFDFRLGNCQYHALIKRFPEGVESRTTLFRKWILEILDNNLEKTDIKFPYVGGQSKPMKRIPVEYCGSHH